jgi:3D (Asp-Asp-Asp) domain-containing protein
MDVPAITSAMRTMLFWLAMMTTGLATAVRCTSYTGSESPRYHDRHGRFVNCQGLPLDESQCAADLRYWPLGTVLTFTDQGGDSFQRTVADCGRLVVGRNHIDLCWRNRQRMLAWGTRFLEVKPMTSHAPANWRVTRFCQHSSKVSHDGHAVPERLDILVARE